MKKRKDPEPREDAPITRAEKRLLEKEHRRRERREKSKEWLPIVIPFVWEVLKPIIGL